jgi:uncharacterized membrane protein YfcA
VSAWNVLLLVLAGAGCGLVNTVAGGGSLILFPALLVTGLAPLPANVTNSVATWPGYLGGVGAFRAEISDRRHLLPPLVAATVVGSVTGCVLLLVTPSAAFDVIVPVLVLLATIMTAMQPWVRRHLSERAGRDRRPPLTAVLGILGATVYGGYFGGGLGVIVLGVLGLTIDDSVQDLTATKSVISLVDATVSVVVFGLFGPVSWSSVLVAAPTCLLGGYLGGAIARRLDERVLRACVVALGLAVSVALFVAL